MASIAETGHAKNVANFKTEISFVKGYGPKYNPFNESLKIPSLINLYDRAVVELDLVKTTKTEFDKATNKRAIAFADLKSFSTQVVRMFASSGVSEKAIADAEGHNRKIQGRRAKAIQVLVPPPQTLTEEQAPLTEVEEDKHISVSQQSYDNLLDNFKELVITVVAHPEYQPNEEELSPVGLQEKVELLTSLNDKVIDSYTDWSNARIARNNTLYNPVTGLKKIALAVKKYVSGIYKVSSVEYKQISSLKFTDMPR